MRVLIACEYSGAVRDAFTARGHYARSCDLLRTESVAAVRYAGDMIPCPCCEDEPYCTVHEMHYADCTCVGPTEDEAEYEVEEDGQINGARHYSGDLFDIDFDREHFDLLIAHPPCTHLAVSGARWLTRHWVSRKSGGYWHDPTEKLQQQAEAVEFVKRIYDLPVPRIAIENPISRLSTLFRKPDQIIQPWQFGHGETKATCLWLKGLPKLRPTNIVDGREQRIWKLPPSADRWKERSRTFAGIAEAMADQWQAACQTLQEVI